MKKFTLSYTIKIIKDGQTEVCLKPSDEQIDDYLQTYRTYENETEAIVNLDSFINEQTPIMFHVFYYTDSIPQEIRDQYEL